MTFTPGKIVFHKPLFPNPSIQTSWTDPITQLYWEYSESTGTWILPIPGIITSGLSLYLDGKNSQSYPGSGNIWYDISGNSRNATIVGSPVFTNGYFDIVSDSTYISVSNTGLVPRTNDFTYSTWIQFDSFDTYDTIFENGFWQDTLLFRHQDGDSIAVYAEGALRGTFSWPTLVGTRYNITFTRQDGLCSLYINSVLTGEQFTMATDINLANQTMVLMRAQYANNQFTDGKISQFLVYDRALSQEEVSYNYSITSPLYA